MKIIQFINKFRFGSFNLKAQDFTKPGNIIQLGYPPLRIDLLTEIDGVTFDECYANKKEVVIDNLVVNFIGYWDLLKNKKNQADIKISMILKTSKNKALFYTKHICYAVFGKCIRQKNKIRSE